MATNQLTAVAGAGTGERAGVVAEALWESMLHPHGEDPRGSGLRRHWRRAVYRPLDTACRTRVAEHRSPQPWHGVRSAVEALAGVPAAERTPWFHGLEGGALTLAEYEALRDGEVALPVVFVAGYPRSGTTAVQSVVRATWPGHLPEFVDARERFSLWNYPKHDPAAVRRADAAGAEAFLAICLARPFLDAAASLVVGRGGSDRVDVPSEVAKWREWLSVADLPSVRVVPFGAVAGKTPATLAGELAQLLNLKPEMSIAATDDYGDLMTRTGHGNVACPRQSNVPMEARSADLLAARAWLADQIDPGLLRQLEDEYECMAQLQDGSALG